MAAAPPRSAGGAAARENLRDAFYCDNEEWKGMVVGQIRVVPLQTLQGLKAA